MIAETGSKVKTACGRSSAEGRGSRQQAAGAIYYAPIFYFVEPYYEIKLATATADGTPYEWHARIKEECESCGVDFLSTPFDEAAVDFLDELGAEAYKIASFELNHIPLIEYAAKKGKTMIISCGMGSPEEMRDAVEACRRQGNDKIVLLKCCSEYPARWGDMHLKDIPDMKEKLGVEVGFSDHSPGSAAAVAAVALGAKVIEKHVKLEGVESADSAFSMNMEDFTSMVRDVRHAAQAVGGKLYELTEGEKDSLKFRRSIFAVKDIAEGEVFTEENIRIIRPGYGMQPKFYPGLLGRPSGRTYRRGEPVKEMI